tara:strand:+ start:150 stop:932 length:783 start_codon:yes stop_codon:yes gene_type:complete
MDFTGKTALITGAGRGIGKETAIKFAEQGADIVLADINSELLDQVESEIKSLGREVLKIVLDISNINQIDQMVSTISKNFDHLDILFNNAGITKHIDFFNITEPDWDQINAINAKGAFFCMQKVSKLMIDQKVMGRIVNTASIAGKGYQRSSNAAYASSKGSVIAMTHIAASVLAKHGINVNAICPGMVQTDMFKNILSLRSEESSISQKDLQKDLIDEIPIGRVNEASDIASLVVFLSGPGSRNITGQTVNIDGGLIMH